MTTAKWALLIGLTVACNVGGHILGRWMAQQMKCVPGEELRLGVYCPESGFRP